MGVGKAIWISVGCRIVLGVVTGWLWILVKRIKLNQELSFLLIPFLSSLFHTVLVMGSIYLLLTPQYAAAKGVEADLVFGLILGTVFTSGIPEAIAAMIIGGLLAKVLVKVYYAGNRKMVS